MSRYTNQTSKVKSLLKDGSWIRRDEEEDEDVDRDPNFGKSILGHYKTTETVESGGSEVKTTKSISTTTSVNALTKRFSETLEEPKSSTLPSSTSISSYTRRTSSVTEEPKSSTTTRTISKDGQTTETTITTSQSVSSSVIKSPTKTETFTERVKSSSQGALYSKITPTRTSKVTETTVTTDKDKDAEEKLYDTLLPSGIKDDYSPTESKRTISTTQTSIVRSSNDTDAEDQLYGTLIPSAIMDDFTDRGSRITRSETRTVESSRGSNSPTLTSPSFTGRLSSYKGYSDDAPTTRTSSYSVSTTPSDQYSSDRQPYSRTDSSYDRSISSTTAYSSSSSYRSSSRSDDNPGDSTYSRSSTKSLYGSSDRLVHEKDLCTYCRKPFTGDAKMVLDDLKINCHATCFKCEVCNCTLGHMKAGDSMWIYNRMVHCENCFEVTRDKWRR